MKASSFVTLPSKSRRWLMIGSVKHWVGGWKNIWKLGKPKMCQWHCLNFSIIQLNLEQQCVNSDHLEWNFLRNHFQPCMTNLRSASFWPTPVCICDLCSTPFKPTQMYKNDLHSTPFQTTPMFIEELHSTPFQKTQMCMKELRTTQFQSSLMYINELHSIPATPDVPELPAQYTIPLTQTCMNNLNSARLQPTQIKPKRWILLKLVRMNKFFLPVCLLFLVITHPLPFLPEPSPSLYFLLPLLACTSKIRTVRF